MYLRKVGWLAILAAVTTATAFGMLTWESAQASAPAIVTVQGSVQQSTPMTDTMPGMVHGDMPMTDTMPGMAPGDMPMTDTMPGMAPGDMPMTEAMPGMASSDMPKQQGAGGMGMMMGNMAKMQRMMARMQRMMANGMMSSGMPMTGTMPMSGTMPMAGMMQGDMSQMMDMMGQMQEMMADMQGMMAGEMMGSGTPMTGQPMQGQPMQGGMMGQMPMMGTMILIAPMPMGGAMMQQAPGMGMMGQMPMMKGMDMGSMMGQMPMMKGMDMGGMMGKGAAQGGSATAPSSTTPNDAAQSGSLGEIEVKVVPPDLSNIQGDTIDFTVDLNATGADLGFDLSKLATLHIGGHEMPATAWEVALDHGHHVSGVLKFPAHLSGAVESAMLMLTDPAGGSDLTLTWPAQK